jgi:hypothetical protein
MPSFINELDDRQNNDMILIKAVIHNKQEIFSGTNATTSNMSTENKNGGRGTIHSVA